jgi:tRNA A-37 threonylcarbamoyl transferase component Bud32
MVVMEYLAGWVMMKGVPWQEQLKYREKLKRALGIIHDCNFVHGNIWCPNILVFEDDIKFIDFDHCGEEGVKRYPWEWGHRWEDMKEGDFM